MAQDIIRQCDITKPPVDLKVVAKYFGLDYQVVSHLPRSVEAAIYPSPPSEPLTATVNKNLPQSDCRFTLAHQLFHLKFDNYPYVMESWVRLVEFPSFSFYETPERILETTLNRIIGKDKHELRADIFAIELLLPPSILQKQLQAGLSKTDVYIEYIVDETVAAFAMSSQYESFFR